MNHNNVPTAIAAGILILATMPGASAAPAEPTAKIDGRFARGSGRVTKVDPAAGKITITHAPIAALGWPKMTMGFKADPKLLIGIAPGDDVDFDLRAKWFSATITAIKKAER